MVTTLRRYSTIAGNKQEPSQKFAAVSTQVIRLGNRQLF